MHTILTKKRLYFQYFMQLFMSDPSHFVPLSRYDQDELSPHQFK